MDEDELYAVAPDRFVAARTALVTSLRADDRRDEAARIAKLRRPSVAASIVNRIVRAKPAALGELHEAGDALRAAQERMLSGDGSTDELREATRRERDAVDALTASASTLPDVSLTAAVSERVAGTLHAAALDADARRSVDEARLTEELQHVGFGDAPAVAPPRPARIKTKTASKTKTKTKAGATATTKATTADAKEAKATAKHQKADAATRDRERTEQRRTARRAERAARTQLTAAERRLTRADDDHAAARDALAAAESSLADARRARDDAAAALDDAQGAVSDLSP